MQNCPTCNAALKGAPICRRCKTDLTKALEAARMAEHHFQAAGQTYSEGCLVTALEHAKRSFSLRRTIPSGRLLACAALLLGDYSLAINTWRRLNR